MPLAPSKSISSYPIRPLAGGMRLDLPPNGMPDGSFLRLQNYRSKQYGIERRDGYVPFDLNLGDDYYNERMLDIIHFYTKDAGAETLYLSDKALYKRTTVNHATNMNITLDFTIDSNTATSESGLATATITIDSDDYDRMQSGDSIECIDSVTYEVASKGAYTTGTSGNASIKIYADDLVADTLAGASTLIYNLKQGTNMSPVYAMLPTEDADSDDQLFIADQAERGLYKYTVEGGLEFLDIDSSVSSSEEGEEVYTNITSAKTIRYYDDRLWMANTTEIDGQHTQRIRWSETLNFDRFYYENYVDLPYTEGECLALVPLGSLLIAYFEDAIYIGRATQITGLPIMFTAIETGNVGLVNTRAVVPWVDSHFFVGQDDIYSLSGTTALQSLESPIISESLEYTKSIDTTLLQYVQVAHDQFSDEIVFLFPDYVDDGVPSSAVATRLWRLSYKTGSWSYDEVHYVDDEKTVPSYYYTGLSVSKSYTYGRTWEDWIDLDTAGVDMESALTRWERGDATTSTIPFEDTFDDYNTWDDLDAENKKPATLKLQVWHSVESKMLLVEEGTDVEVDTLGTDYTYPIWALIESPDYDLGAPDVTKTYTRLSLKTFQNRTDRLLGTTSPLVFDIFQVSESMGWKWKRPQTVRWPVTQDNSGNTIRAYNEAKIDFRATGSTLRFKLVSSAEVPKWRLSEFVILYTARGAQINN